PDSAPDYPRAGSAACAGSAPGAPRRGERCEHDGGTDIVAGGIVESAAAGYQAQGGEVGRAVNGLRREPGFAVLAHARDAEYGRDPVGERHVDGGAPLQGPEAEEDGGAPLAVDVALDDRRADLAPRRRVTLPSRQCGASPAPP